MYNMYKTGACQLEKQAFHFCSSSQTSSVSSQTSRAAHVRILRW